jgi:hypothetical protein
MKYIREEAIKIFPERVSILRVNSFEKRAR